MNRNDTLTRRSHHLVLMKGIAMAVLTCWGTLPVQAEIRTDGSLGNAGQTLNGPQFIIPETLGRLAGTNLFHSFRTFNIAKDESARFTTSTPGIGNVISRVTGGSTSTINGALQLKAASGTPNFLFINPVGVTFGTGASIDVPGAFHVSTADYLKFPDGQFFADPGKASQFSSHPPEAFGFMGSTGTVKLIDATVAFKSTVGLSGSEITVSGSHLKAPTSQMTLVATGEKSTEVPLASPASATQGGRITIGNSKIDVTGAGAGIVGIYGGDISVTGSSIFADNDGSGNASIGQGIDIRGNNITINASDVTSDSLSQGKAGTVQLIASGTVTVSSDASVSSDTYESGNAGKVFIQAGALLLDGQGNTNLAANISSEAHADSLGHAGDVDIVVNGDLTMRQGSLIASDSASQGNAGNVKVSARHIDIDGAGSDFLSGVFSRSYISQSGGHSGNLELIGTGDLTLKGAQIAAFSRSGDVGSLSLRSNNATIEGKDRTALTGVFSQAGVPGSSNKGGIDMEIADRLFIHDAQVFSTSFSSDLGSSLRVSAGSISLDGQDAKQLTGLFSRVGAPLNELWGRIRLNATGDFMISNGAQITSTSTKPRKAGSIEIDAKNMTIDGGNRTSTGVFSDARTGSGGNLHIHVAEKLAILEGGQISTSVFSNNQAGSISVSVGNLEIETQGSSIVTGILSQARTGTGNAGAIDVTVAEALKISNGSKIPSSTWDGGNAGTISVTGKSILIDKGQSDYVTGILSNAEATSTGAAGNVLVSATENLNIVNGGVISSDTLSSGKGGAVSASSPNITINGQQSKTMTGIFSSAYETSTGQAGDVSVSARDTISVLQGGLISAFTYSSSNAGVVNVAANNVLIDANNGSVKTGISSDAWDGSSGNAGKVNISVADTLTIRGAGVVSSLTKGPGVAGDIAIGTGNLHIEGNGSGIFTTAYNGSSGQSGSIIAVVGKELRLSDRAEISIENGASLASTQNLVPKTIDLAAHDLQLDNASITAASFGNINAGNIKIAVSGGAKLQQSKIATSANHGYGGDVALSANQFLLLEKSEMTTSVAGTRGDGGDIDVKTPTLVLNTGFIQANTAAIQASGGNVVINTDSLIPSGNTLFLGGNTPYRFQPQVFGYNVIQAAAPEGLSGDVRISSPSLDLSATLAGINAKVVDQGELGRNPCQTSGGNSFSQAGRGGLPASARGTSRLEMPSKAPSTRSLAQGTLTPSLMATLTCVE